MKEDIEQIWQLEVESRKWYKKFINKKYLKLEKTNVDEKCKREFIKDLPGDLKKRNDIILVAVVDNQIVGWIISHFYRWKWSDKPPLVCKIGNITILKKFKRKGIAMKLMRKVEKEAKKRNAKYIYLGVWTNNKPAYNLYKNMKYEKSSHVDMFKILK